MQSYRSERIRDLARELSAGLLRLRKGYIDAAEDLLQILNPTEEYPYEFVVFRITGFRNSKQRNDVTEAISGKVLRKDLQTLILELCDSFDYGVGLYAEPVFDTAALAEKYNVSTKTIQRWRKRGLVARRMVFPNGRRRIAFLQRSVEHFTAGRESQVERSSRFSQLSDEERDEIIRRAKRMASFAKNSCLHDVAKRLATKMNRAVETIRYTIRNHDKENPQQAVFPELSDPLDEPSREQIYESFLRGVAVPVLAERYKRTRSSIYRVINEMRAERLRSLDIDYVYNPQFDLPTADEIILGPLPETDKPRKKVRAPKDLPPYLASLYEVPLLSAEQERHLFRKYNYLKYKADKLREGVDPSSPKMADVSSVEQLMVQSNAVKNQIVRANLRLVVSIARKHVSGGPQNLFELISDGNVSLMRAAEKFDYSRGFKFSTYASWAIMKNYARSVPRERFRQGRYLTGQEDTLDVAAGMQTYDPREFALGEIRESLDNVLAQLSPRERAILVDHYGLKEQAQPATLELLGKKFGISKERVRQIEISALKKMRAMLYPDKSQLLRNV